MPTDLELVDDNKYCNDYNDDDDMIIMTQQHSGMLGGFWVWVLYRR